MKGFGRTVKDALYSGYRNGITGIVISLMLMGLFWLLGCGSDGKVDFTTSLMKGNIFIFYGIMMTLFNSLLSINGEISLRISMGCTRKAVVPGNMMGNLIFAFFMCVSCLVCRWIGDGSLGRNTGMDVMVYASLFLCGGGIGAGMSVLADMFGKKIYNIALIVNCIASGVFTSIMFTLDSTISFDFLRTPLLPVIAVLIFLGGYGAMWKYVSRLDVRQ